MKPASNTPMLGVLYICVAGCSDGGGHGSPAPAAAAPPTATVTVTIKPTAPVAHVQFMTLQVTHAILRRAAADPVYVMTDDSGTEIGLQAQRCDNLGNCQTVQATKNMLLQQRGTTLEVGTIASEHSVPVGDYQAVEIHVVNVPNVRDSYVYLDDGRECELTVSPVNGPYLSLALHESIAAGQMLRLNLALDFGELNPAECDADGNIHVNAVLGIDEAAL